MEQFYNLRTVGVSYKCDSCNGGEMFAWSTDLFVANSTPLRFRHTCDQCGAYAELLDRYPTVRHQRIQNG